MADQQKDALVLEHERIGNKVKVTARFNGEPKHIDTLDPANANHRQRFIKDLVNKLPQANREEIDAELMRIADGMTNSANPAPSGGLDELDISRIVRPEQFFTADVSGLTVPVVQMLDGRPAPRWTLYLRWADGRRECRELSSSIDLANDKRLWIHPIPGEPSMTTAAGWSARARHAWLSGSAGPNPAELFMSICERIAHFIDLPTDVAAGTTATLALWSMFTYTFQAWDSVPYLYVGGPLSSGKTRVFEILSRLVCRSMQSSNLTAPALFRTLNDRGGTLLFDEAERLRQSTPDVSDILSMLLAGYKRGGQAIRLEAFGDTFRPVAFDVYGPKALACIAGLPPALSSRCISIMMFRAGPDSVKPKRRIDADPAGWQRLRDDLHALALENGNHWMTLAQRTDVCPERIHGRDFELWQPLFALAAWLEEHGAKDLLKLLHTHALASVEANKDGQTPEADELLLEILTENIKDGQPPTPGEILSEAKTRDPNTFDRKYAPWHPRTVSQRLKNYGIQLSKKSHGERRYREVTINQLLKVQRNYAIDLGIVEDADLPTSCPSPPRSPRVHR